MSKLIGLAIIAVMLTGCASLKTAKMLVPVGGPYGPTSGPRVGVVAYLPGSLFAHAMEQDAMKKMYTACQGHYKVLQTKRGPFVPFVPAQAGDGRYVNVQAMGDPDAIYIEFQCTDTSTR